MDSKCNMSEDVATSYMISLIFNYNLSDHVQVVDRVFVKGKHKTTIYQTIGQFKKIYNIA